MVMHAPYHRIVRKGFARLLPIDRLSQEMGAQALSDAQILNREASVVSHHAMSLECCINRLELSKPHGIRLAHNALRVRTLLSALKTTGHRPCLMRGSLPRRPQW